MGVGPAGDEVEEVSLFFTVVPPDGAAGRGVADWE